MGQLEGERPGIWAEVSVKRCDVDGVGLWLLAHLCLLREDPGGIVIDILQVDLDGAGAARFGFTCMVIWTKEASLCYELNITAISKSHIIRAVDISTVV